MNVKLSTLKNNKPTSEESHPVTDALGGNTEEQEKSV